MHFICPDYLEYNVADKMYLNMFKKITCKHLGWNIIDICQFSELEGSITANKTKTGDLP
jgi:hypothetical protein